jgi:hypothetical protein
MNFALRHLNKIVMLIAALVFLWIFWGAQIANAQGNLTDTRQSNDMNTVSGSIDISGGSSKALGLGRSSFDVDINQCMGSTSWDTILMGKQKLVLNWVCLTEFYIKTSQPELAAMAICNTEMLDEFESEAECEAAHDFFVDVVEAMPMVAVEDDHDDEDYRELAQKLEELEQREPQVIERTVIQKQEFLSAEKRAALQEVLDE